MQTTTPNLDESIRAAINEGKRLSRERQAADVNVQQKPETHKGTEPRNVLTLIPYTVVRCLSSLENIYETRLFGWVLAKAQSVLKLYNKDLSAINIEHALGVTRVTLPARLILTEDSKNYSVIDKAFSLADKKIDYEKDNTVYHLSIIAFPELRKDGRKSLITFLLHNQIWHALLDFTKGYRLFNLDIYMRLKTKYSVVLYLLISHQSGAKTYTIEALRQFLGCSEQRAYDRGVNFFKRVLDPAREELKEKAPWYFEYTARKDGRQHRYCEVVLCPVLNKNIVLATDTHVLKTAAEMRLRLDPKVADYLAFNFKMTAREAETIEPLLLRLGSLEQQLAYLEGIRHHTLSGRVKNAAGYLVRALQNNFK